MESLWMVKKIQPRISCPFRLSTYIDCPNIGIICILFFSPITRSFLLQYTQIYMKSEAGGPCALLFFVKNCQSFVMWLSGQRGVRWASGQGCRQQAQTFACHHLIWKSELKFILFPFSLHVFYSCADARCLPACLPWRWSCRLLWATPCSRIRIGSLSEQQGLFTVELSLQPPLSYLLRF